MRLLPQVAVATATVMVVPVGLVWWLRTAAIVTSDWLCVALAIVASAALAAAGNAYWKRCEGSERVVFSDLLVWGWIRRMRLERKLASVVELVGGARARAELEEPGSERRGELLQALAEALDAQDPYTEGHSRRVARHAAMLARELHLSDDEVERIRAAAAVHDVGKLRVPAALLSKPGKLTPEEFEVIKGHATEGAALVAALGDEELAAIVLHHHERFDGHGYPSGLAGTDIPLGARIVAVADTFDAITSIRSYRSAASHKQALDRLAEAAGTQLDPAAVRAFLRYYTGRKGSVAWVGLAVAPQRLIAWMHGNAGVAGNFAGGEALATLGSIAAVGVAAMGAAAWAGVGRAALRGGPPALVAQRAHVARSSSPRTGGSSASGPSPVASAALGAGTAVRAADAAHAGRGRALAYVSLRASAPRAHPAPGGGVHPGRPPAGGSVPGGRVAPHHGQTRPPDGRRHSAAGAQPGRGPAPTPAGGSGAVPGGTAAPNPTVAAPVTPAPPTTPAPVDNQAPSTPTSPAPASSGVSSGPPQSVPPSPPPATGPTSKDQCKGGGFAQWGFKNQGLCIASVNGH